MLLLFNNIRFYSPEFTVPVSGFEFKITSENGMFSYGVGNVGTYSQQYLY